MSCIMSSVGLTIIWMHKTTASVLLIPIEVLMECDRHCDVHTIKLYHIHRLQLHNFSTQYDDL